MLVLVYVSVHHSQFIKRCTSLIIYLVVLTSPLSVLHVMTSPWVLGFTSLPCSSLTLPSGFIASGVNMCETVVVT